MNTAHSNLPTFFTAGALASIGRKDAGQYLRGLITRHCVAPEHAGFHLVKNGDGWYYEIQENGTGRALLPSILKKLISGEAELVIVATATRPVQVHLKEGQIDCSMLPELDVSAGAGDDLEQGPRLTPCEPDHSRTMVASLAVCCVSILALVAGIVVNMIVPSPSPSQASTYMTHAENLPIANYPGQVQQDEFIYAVRFDGKKWATERRRVTVSPVPVAP